MNQDVDYKQLVDAWLESDEKDIDAGALLLLKLNRNRVLHQYITRKRALDKLIYEMKKQSDILDARVNHGTAKLTEVEVKELTHKSKKAEQTLAVVEKGVKGKRPDHDQLSPDVQKAHEDNLVIYPKMRSLHEKLKLMENDRPCDRYPFLKELVELDGKVRKNWKLYDKAKVVTVKGDNQGSGTEAGNPVLTASPVLDAKGVSAARKYLSGNKKKLVTLKDKDIEKYNLLLAEMQKRYNDLIASGQTIDEKQVAALKEAGIAV